MRAYLRPAVAGDRRRPRGGRVCRRCVAASSSPTCSSAPPTCTSAAPSARSTTPHSSSGATRTSTSSLTSAAPRLVQTNEARRSSFLLPALALVASASPSRPLALVEVGASAGLLLAFDRYRYEYRFTPDATVAATAGDPNAPVLVACDLRSSRIPPVAIDSVPLVDRVGIDLDPVLPTDTGAVEWLRALVWPDHPDRRARLDAALALVAADPVPLVRGDALEVLAAVVGRLGAGVTPVVFHTATLIHFDERAGRRFRDLVPRIAASRGGDLVWVFAESRSSVGWNVEVVDFRVPEPTPVRIAEVNAHGTWLRWTVKER